MSRSVAKIEQRLASKIEEGEYYEAHQMIRTIASRYKTSRKIKEALKLVHDGSVQLYKFDQIGSASDLGLMYSTLLEETDELTERNYAEISSLHLCTITKLEKDHPERDQFEKRILQRSIDISGEKFGEPKLRLVFAKNYFQLLKTTKDDILGTSLLVNARGHFQYSNDPKSIAEFLVTYSKFGQSHEVEYFCCQMMLQLLYRNALETARDFLKYFCEFHPSLKNKKLPYNEPLVNFCHMLMSSIKDVNVDSFLFLKSSYEPFLLRPDRSLHDYVERIGEIYFNIQPLKKAQEGGLMGMIQNMMGGMGGMESSDEDEEFHDSNSGPARGQQPPQLDMGSLMGMANDMLSGMMNQNQPRAPSRASTQPTQRQPEPVHANEEIDDLD